MAGLCRDRRHRRGPTTFGGSVTETAAGTAGLVVVYGVAVQHDESSIASQKGRLRSILLAGRRSRTASDRLAAGDAISDHLLSGLAATPLLAAYLPLPTEPLQTRLLDLLADRTRVLVPVVTGAAPLDWCDYPGPVTQGALGITEPTGPRLGPAMIAAVDVLLVPALAVDPAGHRLGRGGGHYDRTLHLLGQRRSPGSMPRVIAVVFDDEVLDAVPHDDLDQPVTAFVTPSRGLRAVS